MNAKHTTFSLYNKAVIYYCHDRLNEAGYKTVLTPLQTLAVVEFINLKTVSFPIIGNVEVVSHSDKILVSGSMRRGKKIKLGCEAENMVIIADENKMEENGDAVVNAVSTAVGCNNMAWSGNHLINICALDHTKFGAILHNLYACNRSWWRRLLSTVRCGTKHTSSLNKLHKYRKGLLDNIDWGKSRRLPVSTSILDICSALPWSVEQEFSVLSLLVPDWFSMINGTYSKPTKCIYDYDKVSVSNKNCAEYEKYIDYMSSNSCIDTTNEYPITSFKSHVRNAIYLK